MPKLVVFENICYHLKTSVICMCISRNINSSSTSCKIGSVMNYDGLTLLIYLLNDLLYFPGVGIVCWIAQASYIYNSKTWIFQVRDCNHEKANVFKISREHLQGGGFVRYKMAVLGRWAFMQHHIGCSLLTVKCWEVLCFVMGISYLIFSLKVCKCY